MKSKYLTLLAALTFMLAGCSDDGGVTEAGPDEPASISVDRTELSFPETGGSAVLNITTENADIWSAFSKISWIEVGEPDLENGTLVITVPPTEEIGDLVGEVILYTEAEEMATVSVTQKGNGIIHDRSSAKRMGLHGDVKELSFHYDPVYQWEYLTSYMTNLEFDRNGMLTYFEYFYFAPPDYTVYYNATLEYDSQSRLTLIDVVSTNMAVDPEGTIPFGFSITLEYGSHGKYIETERIFSWIAGNSCYTTHRTWLPKMIKDLKNIKVYNPITTPTDFGIIFDDAGESNKLWTLSNGQYKEQDFMRYEFIGDFTHKVIYPYFFLGYEGDFAHIYSVDTKSGYILRLLQADVDQLIGLNLFDKFYHTDLRNSLYRYEDAFDYGYEMYLTYNDNYDVIYIDEKYNGFSSEMEYEYDDHGNWISVLMRSVPDSYFPIESSRTITYWEE